MKPIPLIAIVLVLLAGSVSNQRNLLAQETQKAATASADIAGVRKLVLPELDPSLPPEHGVATVKLMCGMCHTPHYILNQPPLSQEAWTAEITKMQKVFNGPIPQESVPEILDYLMKVRGL